MDTSTIINIHDNSKNRIAKKHSNNILVINEYRFYHHLLRTNMKAVREVGRLISGPSKIATKNGPCIDGLPIKHGDFPLAILNYQRVPILFGLIIRSRWSKQNTWHTCQTYPILVFNATIKGISPEQHGDSKNFARQSGLVATHPFKRVKRPPAED